MTFLIIIACLNGNCREVTIAGPMPVFECMTAQQPLAAQWIARNPDYTIQKLLCTLPEA